LVGLSTVRAAAESPAMRALDLLTLIQPANFFCVAVGRRSAAPSEPGAAPRGATATSACSGREGGK
jgi:hypothetical protein